MNINPKKLLTITVVILAVLLNLYLPAKALTLFDPISMFSDGLEFIWRIGLIFLLLWSIVSFGLGVIKYKKSPYFGQMNIAWSIINLSIALLGIVFLNTLNDRSTDIFIKYSQIIEKVIIVNCFLDISYIALGQYLKNKSSVKSKQWGRSILIQGIFLLCLDLTLAFTTTFLNYQIILEFLR